MKRVVTGAATAVAIAAIAYGADMRTLSTLLFLANGLWHVTFQGLRSTITNSTFAPRKCYSDLPWSLRVWEAIEERASSQPNIDAVHVKIMDWSDSDAACSQTLLDRDAWHEPFLIRGLARMRRPITAERLLELGPRHGNVSVTDMRRYSESWSSVAECPHLRQEFHSRQVPASVVLEGPTDFYASFSEDFASYIKETFAALKFWMRQLDRLCDTFHGLGSEAFFGFGAAAGRDQPRIGTPFHAAGMSNLFLQVEGERSWTLIHPRLSQYLRPMHGHGHVAAPGVAVDWRQLTRRRHFSRLPRMVATTRPGDVLYIPPWWWHEVTLESPGFSFGVSNRGYDFMMGGWRKWPVLRFVPWINGGSWSLDSITLDLVQQLPIALTLGLGKSAISVEESQHGR